MDNHSQQVRSYNMSRISNKNTKPEVIVRSFLFSKGFRYRKNVRSLPGCPDIVLPKYKVVIFVNGCFWHVHEGCPDFVWPANNQDYWEKKLLRNQQRDKNNIHKLKCMGWNTIVIWECELKKSIQEMRLGKLVEDIKRVRYTTECPIRMLQTGFDGT